MALAKNKELRSGQENHTKVIDTTAAKEDGPFAFLSLPAEIRKQIYGYLLIEPKPISLHTWSRYHGKAIMVRSDYPSRQDAYRIRHGIRQIRKDSSAEWRAATPALSLIILTNKQIYLEATQVVYGENLFEFETTISLRDFLAATGNCAQHVRFVALVNKGNTEVFEPMLTNARAAFMALAVAKSLKRLRIDHTFVCTSPTASHYSDCSQRVRILQLVADCKDLLKTLKASRTARNVAGDVLDIVDFGASNCRTCNCFACSRHRATRPGFSSFYKAAVKEHRKKLCGCRCGGQTLAMPDCALVQFKKAMAKHLE